MIGFSISTARSWGRLSSLPHGVASVGISNARIYAPQRPTHGIALRGIGYVPPVVNVVYKAIGRPFGITNVPRFARIESNPKGIATERIGK